MTDWNDFQRPSGSSIHFDGTKYKVRKDSGQTVYDSDGVAGDATLNDLQARVEALENADHGQGFGTIHFYKGEEIGSDDGRHFRVAGNTSDQTIKTFSIPVTMPDGTTPSAVVLMTNSRSCTYSNFKSFDAAAAVSYKPRGSNTWPGAAVLINAQAEIAGGGERTGDNNIIQYGKNYGPGEQCIIPVDTDGKVHFRLHVPQVSSSYKGGLPTIEAWIVGVIGGGQTPPANDYSNLDTRIKALEAAPVVKPVAAAKPFFRRFQGDGGRGWVAPDVSGNFTRHGGASTARSIYRAPISGLSRNSLVVANAGGNNVLGGGTIPSPGEMQAPYYNTDAPPGNAGLIHSQNQKNNRWSVQIWHSPSHVYVSTSGRSRPIWDITFTIWV